MYLEDAVRPFLIIVAFPGLSLLALERPFWQRSAVRHLPAGGIGVARLSQAGITQAPVHSGKAGRTVTGGPAACPQPVGPHSASLCGLVAGFLWPVYPPCGWSFGTLFGSSELMSPKGRGLVPRPSLPSLMARACGLYVGTCFNPCRSRGHQEHVALGLPGRVTHWQENCVGPTRQCLSHGRPWTCSLERRPEVCVPRS